MEPEEALPGIRKQAVDQARQVKEEVVASQDDTPTEEPKAGGNRAQDRDRSAPHTGTDDLSDASTTIVSGSHAIGTDPGRPGRSLPGIAGLANSPALSRRNAFSRNTISGELVSEDAEDSGSSKDSADSKDSGDSGKSIDSGNSAAAAPASVEASAPPEDATELGAEDTDFLRETGQRETGLRETGAAGSAEAGVVPGGHPSVAQRSTLPMRRASTMPDVSRFGQSAPETGTAETGITETGTRETNGGETDTATEEASSGATPASKVPSAATSVTVPAVMEPAAAAATGVAATAAMASVSPVIPAAAAAPAAEAEKPAGTPESEVPAGPAAEKPEDIDAISEEEIRRRAEERERAGETKPVLARVLQVMIAVFFPVMLLAAAIRAVATPLFLWVEYHRPGFPADSYGFSTDDRMTYGSYAVDYILNFSGPRYLGELMTPSGESLYLESEVSHMADVKSVLTMVFIAALAMAVLSVIACVYLARRYPGGIRRGLFAGAVLTLVLVGALIVLAVLGWESFFTQVHSIFFANGNWTFRLDDTLIRLFPAQFWMDAGIAIAGLVLLSCLAVLIAAWPTKSRRERSRLAQEAKRRRYLESLEAV